MTGGPALIVEVPSGGRLDRRLRSTPPPETAVVRLPADAEGRLEAPDAGQVVMSVPSPEALVRESDEVRRVVDEAGTGTEPLVVVVEAAEELRADELAPLLEAAERSRRSVILRVMGDG
jgi:hypothetical protein